MNLFHLFFSPVTFSVLNTNILSVTLVSDTLYLCDGIRVAGTVSHYCCGFAYLDRKLRFTM
jgi:hypothetical protein